MASLLSTRTQKSLTQKKHFGDRAVTLPGVGSLLNL